MGGNLPENHVFHGNKHCRFSPTPIHLPFFPRLMEHIDHATAIFSYINRSISADLGVNVAKHIHQTRSNGHLRLDEHREFLTLASYTLRIHVWYICEHLGYCILMVNDHIYIAYMDPMGI